MPLTHEELAESCRKNGITCLLCEQDYEATKRDVLDDNPELEHDETELKEATMWRMLDESLDFGPLNEDDDEIDRDDHSDRMDARCEITEFVANRWVDGLYLFKARNSDRSELEWAQDDVRAKVSEWFGGQILDTVVDEIMAKTNDQFTVEDPLLAEYIGKTEIEKYFQTTCAKTADEFCSEVSTGFSGSPLDGSPFGAAEAEKYATDYWERHHE